MPKNPVKYAEEDLGVHTTYQELLDLEVALRASHEKLRTYLTAKRALVTSVIDREMEVTSDERGRVDISQTAFDKHIKSVLNGEPALRALKEQLAVAERAIDETEHSIREIELQMKNRQARLRQLGGYLEYLATAKQAQSIEKSREILLLQQAHELAVVQQASTALNNSNETSKPERSSPYD